MLKECKCLLCKNYIYDRNNYFEHKCNAYPKGIPDEIFNEDCSHTDCRNKNFHYERKESKLNRP